METDVEPNKPSAIALIIGFAVGTIIGGVILVFLTVIPTWAYMAIFVQWFKYDYVTASSIFFFIFCVGAFLSSMRGLFVSPSFTTLLSLILSLALVPYIVAIGLSVYVRWEHPAMSQAFDLVGAYQSALNHGFTSVIAGVASFAPALGAKFGLVYSTVQQDPLLRQIVGYLVCGALAKFIFPPVKRLRLLPEEA